MDTTSETTDGSPDVDVRRWRPLSPTQRRVLGVLVEKAKTTPEQYPMSLNALTTGCNQKNNRDPLTELTSDQVELALEDLREMGAALEIQGTGRVAKYKHLLYEWLGVDKVELAVIAELLLRGAQTVGELRGRAARMEPIADLQALRPVLQSLKQKQLVLELSPEGRGQVISHNLYKDRELDEIRSRAAGMAGGGGSPGESGGPPAAVRQVPELPGVTREMYEELQRELVDLRTEVRRLAGILDQLVGP